MRTFRASEIGSFLYCRRAWWYQKQGKPSQNQSNMEAGNMFHAEHGAQVARAGFFRTFGWIILLAGLVLLAVSITLYLIN